MKVFNKCPDCLGAGTSSPPPASLATAPAPLRKKSRCTCASPRGSYGTRLRLRGEGEARNPGRPTRRPLSGSPDRPPSLLHPPGAGPPLQGHALLVEAALGATITRVPTLNSQTRLAVPPGSQTGAASASRDQDCPGLKGKSPGDLVVEVALETPSQLSEAQKQLLKDFLRL